MAKSQGNGRPERRRRMAAAALAMVLLASPAAQAADSAPMIGANATRFTLDNGLQVVVIPDHRAPVVTHMIWYKVGSADEVEGKTGIAHFLEHLMFKGTKTHPEGEFSRVISEIGGEENAFTTTDTTAYYQRVAKEKLGLVMGYEADRMANLVLDDRIVAPERDVVLEERSMRLDGEPGAQLAAAVAQLLYLRHPYGIPIIGWREDIQRLGASDAIAFYDRYYTPNNAVLVVAGDVTTDEVRAAAEATYGKVARRAEPPPRVRPLARELDMPREITKSDPKVTQEAVQVSWLVPSYRTARPGEAEALDVLVEAVGGGPTSILYRDLVVGRKLASSAGLAYDGNGLDAGQLIAYAVPREGVALEDLRAALLQALADATAAPLDDAAIARAKARLEADTIYAQDSQQALARIFGSTLATGGTLDDVQSWPSRIRGVTLERVKAAARELDPDESVTGYLRKPSPEQRS